MRPALNLLAAVGYCKQRFIIVLLSHFTTLTHFILAGITFGSNLQSMAKTLKPLMFVLQQSCISCPVTDRFTWTDWSSQKGHVSELSWHMPLNRPPVMYQLSCNWQTDFDRRILAKRACFRAPDIDVNRCATRPAIQYLVLAPACRKLAWALSPPR